MNEFLSQYMIDIILALIFTITTIKYFIKGFAKTVLDAVTFLLSIVLSRSVSGTVTDWVFNNTKLFANIEKYIAALIITAICFVAISILLKLATVLINKFFKIPVLKQANKLLGGILGALCGGVLVVVLCIVLQFTARVSYNTDYADAVKDSAIVQLVLSEEKINEGIAALK